MRRLRTTKRKTAATFTRREDGTYTVAKDKEPTANTVEENKPTSKQITGKQEKIFQWTCSLGCRCCVACEGLTMFTEKNGRLAGIQELGWLRWIASVNHNTGEPFEKTET